MHRINKNIEDDYIKDILNHLKSKFTGWSDVQDFNELKGSLLAIKKNIDDYYVSDKAEHEANLNKKTKIFISHSSKDGDYVNDLVEFLEDIGVRNEHLFCSSIPGYGIPLNEDIYEYLRKEFQNFELYVFFILSDNYYESTASMNEMGAAWVLQYCYTAFLLPGFDFKEINGAINPRKIGIKLYSKEENLKEMLFELKNDLVEKLSLEQIHITRWEKIRDKYIKRIKDRIQSI